MKNSIALLYKIKKIDLQGLTKALNNGWITREEFEEIKAKGQDK